MSDNLNTYIVEKESARIDEAATKLTDSGVPLDIAKRIVSLSSLFSVMDLAEIANNSRRGIAMVSNTYFKLGARMGLHWFLDQITNQPVANHWQRWPVHLIVKS